MVQCKERCSGLLKSYGFSMAARIKVDPVPMHKRRLPGRNGSILTGRMTHATFQQP